MSNENERIKLKASFCNYIAAGAAIAGLVLPYISIYSSIMTNYGTAVSNPLALIKGETVASMLCAFVISF